MSFFPVSVWIFAGNRVCCTSKASGHFVPADVLPSRKAIACWIPSILNTCLQAGQEAVGWWLFECSPGGHFLPQAVKALPSCPRSLDLKWCRLPHLRYAHGPADLDLACAPQGTFHALISAIPCLSASLQMRPHPQHWLLSKPIKKHYPISVPNFQREFSQQTNSTAAIHSSLPFPFWCNLIMNHSSPVDKSNCQTVELLLGISPQGASYPSLKSFFISTLTILLTLLSLSIGISPFEETKFWTDFKIIYGDVMLIAF